MPRNNAFTMIELMVVISIIGILTAIGVLSYVTTQKNARDSRRKADLEELRTAIEMYKADNGYYPGPPDMDLNSTEITGEDDLTTHLIAGGYLKTAIIDPRDDGEANNPLFCGSPNSYRYNYWVFPARATFACVSCNNTEEDNHCTEYALTAMLENAAGIADSPCEGSTIYEGCCTGGQGSNTNCYAKFNP